METNYLHKILLLSLLAICLAGCNDEKEEKIYPLTFERTNYEARINSGKYIMVRSGNKDYSLAVANPELLDASVSLSGNTGFGDLLITGKQKGETTLTVTDNINKEKVDLTIRIVDSYIGFRAVNTNHPRFKTDNRLFLVNDNAQTFYLYDADMKNQTKGTYQLSAIDNTPYLTLYFEEEIEGKREYRFDMRQSSPEIYAILRKYLDIDPKTSVPGRRSVIKPVLLCLQEVVTDFQANFIYIQDEIPYGILK